MSDALLPKGITMDKVADATELLLKQTRKNDLGSFSTGAKKITPAYLANFAKDQRPYMKHLKHLYEMTGGMEFGHRGNDNYKKILDHFSSIRGGGANPYYFAENVGIPAGGQTNAIVDVPLTDISNAFVNDMWIAKQILTDAAVMERSGKIGEFGNEQNNPPDADEVLVEGRANVKQLNPLARYLKDYRVMSYGIQDSLSPDDYRNVMSPFVTEEETILFMKAILMLICEIQLAEQMMNVATYADVSNHVITLSADADKFSSPSSSSVDKQVQLLRDRILADSGMEVNTAVMDKTVFENISRHPQARGTIFAGLSEIRTATEQDVMKLLQVDRLFIGRSARANSSARDAKLSRVWGKDVWLGYIAPTRGKRQLTFGYHHHFATGDSLVISRQSIGNPMNKDFFCYENWQHNLTDPRCGGLIKNAIA